MSNVRYCLSFWLGLTIFLLILPAFLFRSEPHKYEESTVRLMKALQHHVPHPQNENFFISWPRSVDCWTATSEFTIMNAVQKCAKPNLKCKQTRVVTVESTTTGNESSSE